MAKLLLVALALAVMAQGGKAHTYYKAELVPFGDQAPDAPDSSAVLDFLTHDGEAIWTLNVTDVQNMWAAKLVYGNPEIKSEPVVTYAALDVLFNGTQNWEGVFNATEFEPEYPWTMTGLEANAGLGHVWAVITNDAAYKNIVLAGPLENYKPTKH